MEAEAKGGKREEGEKRKYTESCFGSFQIKAAFNNYLVYQRTSQQMLRLSLTRLQIYTHVQNSPVSNQTVNFLREANLQQSIVLVDLSHPQMKFSSDKYP